MIDLRNYKDWDKVNGTLSVTLNPKNTEEDSRLHVVLNGSMGNFCLDYTNDDYDPDVSKERAWSSDTGYHIKITQEDKIIVTRWWDGYEETLPIGIVQQKPQRFYEALIKNNTRQTDNIISFAKETFVRLRNCIPQSDNGQISLLTFMYLLASLEEGVDSANNIDTAKASK